MKPEEVFRVLDASDSGISEEEVIRRRAAFGPNAVAQKSGTTRLKIFIGQFKSPLILTLVVAGGATLFLGRMVETAVIFAAVLLNALLGFYQEYKAETALEALASYVRTRCRVKRKEGERELDAQELVPGDLIRVAPGDRIPADARIIFANNLQVDESVLTGESLPAEKQILPLSAGAQLSERRSMVFSGTLAVEGYADALVTAIGNATEFGKIASFVQKKKREATPLEQAMIRFSLGAGGVLGILVILLFGLGVASGYKAFDMFLIGVAVAVSAVPEGLPVALTVILTVGVERLAKKKAIVRRMLAAETLGSTSVILTDKTGTLTQAKMEIAGIVPCNGQGNSAEQELLAIALTNADVVVENPKDPVSQWRMFGRPLEVALARGAAERGVFFDHIENNAVVERLPFNSRHKFSASVVSSRGGRSRAVFFGAPEILLSMAILKDAERNKILEEIDRRALAGERVLGVAAKSVPDGQGIDGEGLWEVEFLGLISFRDPLRPGVGAAIAHIRAAGVKTIILTGDHKGTADAVARELGLIDGKGAVITGQEIKLLEKQELFNRADEISVYARATPEEKVDVTRLYQQKGHIVAVTGDGVNDAPALQAANIGVAVGSGTDVAKGVADLVLLDDNFETLVAAIEEGRKILDNIRKVIVYLLSSALDELLLIGGSLVLGLPLPLNALQILFVNFFSDSFPAVGFAFEHGVDGLGGKPRALHKNLFDRTTRFLILVIGASTSVLLFALYYFLLRAGFSADLVRSFIFATFASYSLVLVFSLRSLERSVFSYNPFSNWYLNGGVLFGLALTALAIYIPFFQRVFGTVPLPPLWLLGVLGVGILNLAAVEFGKRFLGYKGSVAKQARLW